MVYLTSFSAALVLASAMLSAAAPTEPAQPAGQCNTGSLQCCQSTQQNTDAISSVAGLLGVVAPIGALVGLNCSPITGIGLGQGASCSAQPVCCTGNTFNGVIALGCTAIKL
ncbi:hypothetical protein HGRIS_010935 [Hohenbuehelia grisea]|uniref:Hydrophobin n=1 Tax=Hohenbuehelia grisea TaxID=104357 RepID=A0ABR3IY96_9AGAR